MKQFDYKNCGELFDDIKSDFDDGSDVTVIARGDHAGDIIREIIKNTDIEICLLNFDPADFPDEYYISILGFNELYVEPVKNKESGKYLSIETDICYIHEDCNSAILPFISGYKFIYTINGGNG